MILTKTKDILTTKKFTVFIVEEDNVNTELGVFTTYEKALECAKEDLRERGFDVVEDKEFLEYDYVIVGNND